MNDILNKKKKSEQIVMITAYDYMFAKIFDEIVDIILVGDSLNMNFRGQIDTINVSLNQMIYHTLSVKMGVKHALVVMDMPFGTCFDIKNGVKNSINAIKKSNADALKIECDRDDYHMIKSITKQGIAVIAHIGLKPQKLRLSGVYKIQKSIDDLTKDAIAMQDAGAVMILVECSAPNVVAEILKVVKIPVIAIGGGLADGQVLVFSDILGLTSDYIPKFAKKYLNGYDLVKNAVKEYAEDVRNKKFPDKNHQYEG